ncbi:MAG: hypothetical protein HOV80_22410 [Polyangiaceae bacterium]|nr:hypothetical protein [Polyangiaceae bacterium]
MRDSWLNLIGRLFVPARPQLGTCLEARGTYAEARRLAVERQARAVSDCVARIEAARADVFAANDGIVTSKMTDLEREWRWLSRLDPDAALMDAWAQLAPARWVDHKRWRDVDPDTRLDAAIALASDVEGVEAAEAAASALRAALAPWGRTIGARVRWRWFDADFEATDELYETALDAATDALAAVPGAAAVLERAQGLGREAREVVLARFPDREVLAAAVAHAAFVDALWHASEFRERVNPVAPLMDLWRSGYVLTAVDATGVTLAIPPL